MTRTRALFCTLVVCLSTLVLAAQSPAAPNLGQSLPALADQRAIHTGFVFDRSMLQFARRVLESEGMDSKRAAAALFSIAYDNYRYAEPAAYSPEAMDAIVSGYRAAGWQHLVNAHGSKSAAAQHSSTVTDLWLHVSGTEIDGITVLTRGARNVNVIQVACELRPLDLIHISGHFGIPKVDPGAVMVPAPDNK